MDAREATELRLHINLSKRWQQANVILAHTSNCRPSYEYPSPTIHADEYDSERSLMRLFDFKLLCYIVPLHGVYDKAV